MAATIPGKLERLESIPLFRSCTRQEIRLLGRLAEVVTVAEGAVLVREGRAGHEFFVIDRGTATVLRDGEPVALLGRGDCFGELALLARTPRGATVVSATTMELVVIEERAFLGLLAEVPTLSRSILEMIAARLQQSDRTGAVSSLAS